MSGPDCPRGRRLVAMMAVLILAEALSSFEHVMILAALPLVRLGGLVVAAAWAALALFHGDRWPVLGGTIVAAFGSTTLLAPRPRAAAGG